MVKNVKCMIRCLKRTGAPKAAIRKWTNKIGGNVVNSNTTSSSLSLGIVLGATEDPTIVTVDDLAAILDPDEHLVLGATEDPLIT